MGTSEWMVVIAFGALIIALLNLVVSIIKAVQK